MASKTFFFSGKARWAMLHKPDEMYNNFKIGVILDDASMAKFQESGSALVPKKTDDGMMVTFRRSVSKVMKGEIVKFGPPEVVDSDGNPSTALVGNDSEVTVKATVYDYKGPRGPGKGTRLEAVRIDKLIEFKPTKQEKNNASPDGEGLPAF